MVQQLIQTVVQSPTLHAKFLNSFSYLEYRGFRKIARSLGTEDINDETLTHTYEEVRHAVYFKRLAMKVGGQKFSSFNTDNLLSEKAIKAYFYDLDLGVAKILGAQPKLIYQLVTWLIEERALKVYRIYESILDQSQFDFSLKPILNDEENHLSEVQQVLKSISLEIKNKLIELEEDCFNRTWQAFEAAI